MDPMSVPITNKIMVYFLNRQEEPTYGRVYSVYFDAFIEFQGIFQLLQAMEALFDTLEMPQASYAKQAPSLKQRKTKNEGPKIERYAKREKLPQSEQATFTIHVVYRQYNTWQGTITWMKDNISCNFKSVLEMLKLMDDALNDANAVHYIWDANKQTDSDS